MIWWASNYWGKWDRFQKFGLLGHLTFISPGEVENFMKSIKDKLYENWEKFLEILKKIRVKLAWPTYVLEEDSKEFRAMLKDLILHLTLTKKKKRSSKLLWNFFTISFSKSPGVFSTIFSKFSKILQNYSKISS